jgi:hypothetical protein
MNEWVNNNKEQFFWDIQHYCFLIRKTIINEYYIINVKVN